MANKHNSNADMMTAWVTPAGQLPLDVAARDVNTEIHYTVIDRDTGERYSTTSSTSRDRTERERNRLVLLDGKAVCLGIGQINPDGTIDDVTDAQVEVK